MATTKGVATKRRDAELRRMLEERRHELTESVQGRMHGAWAKEARDRAGLDEGEVSETEIQDEIELALLQMQSETLRKVNDALRRLAEGAYGRCLECGEDIAAARLRALPFALRCKDCEEVHETAERYQRRPSSRGASLLAFDTSD